MAEPQAEPEDAVEEGGVAGAEVPSRRGPDQHVLQGWESEVRPGPGGGRFLVIHCFNRGEALLLDISDDRRAERIADEVRPSRVVPAGNRAQRRSGLVVP